MKFLRTTRIVPALVAAPAILSAALLGCSDSSTPTTTVSFEISDAPVGDLEAVVITIDEVTINQPGDDIVIDSFPAENPEDPDTDTITIDLLQFQGLDSVLVIDGLELEVGDYQNLRLSIVATGVDASYVEEEGGERFPIKQPSNELKLGGFEVTDTGLQTFVIEFNVAKALTYNPGPERYILKPRGVSIVDVAVAALVEGTVEEALFTGTTACAEKEVATVGNTVYLYEGHDLDTTALGDNFDPEEDPEAAANLVEPLGSEIVGEDGAYLFAYLEPGAYTVAFSCDAEGDDPEVDDGIVIPLPEDQIHEFDLGESETVRVDFTGAGTG